jgi:hypothetical protein
MHGRYSKHGTQDQYQWWRRALAAAAAAAAAPHLAAQVASKDVVHQRGLLRPAQHSNIAAANATIAGI